MCHDQLQRAFRDHVSQEVYADAAAHQEMAQLRQLISQQAETMKRFESQSQQYVTQQHDEWTQKQHAQFQKFDGVIRDKDEVIQSLRQELANTKEHHLQELDQALQDAQRRAQQATPPVFAGAPTQPYATPVEKKTHVAVAAVAHAEAVPACHSPGLSLGASAGKYGNMNLKAKNKGSSTMVIPVRRRLRNKTPPAAAQRVPSMGLVRRGMRSKGSPPPEYAQLPVPSGSGGVPGADPPGGGPPPPDQGPPVSLDRQALPPGLPLQSVHNPPDDGGDGHDSGGDSDHDGDETPVTDLDLQEKRPHKPPGDPDSSGDDGGRGRRGRHQAPITINKWAKPLPSWICHRPRIHLQKASKIKQIWELWSVNVALAMSTWNDIAVTYWHQVYTQSEDIYQQWRRSGMADRFAYEKRYLYGRKAPVPATCDAVEALLRHELLAHIPEWLSRKAGVLGCTSSGTILFMCWKEIFPNEDATRFDLVDELYALPAKMPTSMFQFAAWLEDWMTKLVAADEVSAHIEPRRAMAVLMNVGKPLQTADNIFMTEWVAVFRESGLRDGEEPPGCMFEVGCFGQSSSQRTSGRSTSRTCTTTIVSQDSESYDQAQAEECSSIGQASVQIFP